MAQSIYQLQGSNNEKHYKEKFRNTKYIVYPNLKNSYGKNIDI